MPSPSPTMDDEKPTMYTKENHTEFESDLVAEARAGTDQEHALTIREGLRLYPKAMLWSALLSTAIIMEGYDTYLLGSFFAYPAFNRKFGTLQVDGTYLISAAWQSGLQNGTAVGQIGGLILNGWASERFGYKRTMIVSLIVMIGFLFIPFFAPNIQVLLVGQILQGLPWGVFQTLVVAYASEIVPTALRAYLTTYVNLCWVLGQLVAAGVLRGLLSNKTEWGYRIPYAIQWVWPVPILIGCIFAPESPWWLVRHGKIDEARKVLVSLTSSKNTAYNPDATIAMIVHTNEFEKSVSAGTSYLDCFKGVDLRRTEITIAVWAVQNLCGSALMGWSSYFLLSAGLSENNAFTLSLGNSALGAVGTIGSWFLMARMGRRTLYLYGLIVLCVLHVVIGGLGLAPESKRTTAGWGIGASLMIFTFVYDITVGPVCYCLVSEVSSTRLRAKTIVLSRIGYCIIGIINNIITPKMLGRNDLNWGAKTAFFWLGMCFLCLVWSYFRLVEPKDRTFGEMDALFEQRISARKFASTKVNQFERQIDEPLRAQIIRDESKQEQERIERV